MKNSTDITEKIRSAIKAKLGQIGAYVDDELPDYIMVMIANKKSMKQISDDLQLFLGSKTERFTDWLDKLLKKLQAVDGDDDEKTEKNVENEKEKKTEEKIEGKKKQGQSDGKSQGGKKKVDTKSQKSDGSEQNRRAKKRRSDEMSKSSKEQSESQPRSDSPKPSSSQLEDAIEIQQQDDAEFEEVVKAKENKLAKREASSKVRKTSDRKLIPTTTGENVPVRKVRQELLREARTRRHEMRRRGMTSVVGSVRLNRSESESESSEDEYYRSGVASVVKPQRRDRPPDPRRQEKLLMRACREATSSVEESARRYSARYRDDSRRTMRCDAERSDRDPTVERGYGSDLDTRYRFRRMESGFKSDYESVTRRRNPPKYKPRPQLVTCGTQTSPVVVDRKKPARQVEAPKMTKQDKSEELKSDEGNKKQEEQSDEKTKSVYDYDPGKTCEYKKQKRSLSPKRLSPEYSPVQINRDRSPEPYIPQTPVSFTVSRELPGYSDSDASIEEVTDDVRRVQCDEVYDRYKQARSVDEPMDNTSCKSSPRSVAPSGDEADTKFIVTLDGMAPVLSRTIAVSDVDDDQKTIDDSNLPMTSTPMDSKHQLDVGQDDENPDDKVAKSLDELIQEKQSNVRCKYWPQCKYGSECPFVHPSAPCHMFPKCSFGSKCLYIHPNCRYDANCVNVDCPYMHASRRDPLAMAAAKVIKSMPAPTLPLLGVGTGLVDFSKPCRYYPNCFNSKCPFIHGRTCRYGKACRSQNNGCTFSHPGSGTGESDRFKWCSTEKFVISSGSSSAVDT